MSEPLRTLLPLQWGRGLSTPEVVVQRARLLRTRALQWGRGLSTPEVGSNGVFVRVGPGAFNGAGVFRPRKYTCVMYCEARARSPSMGPGSFDPGSASSRCRRERCFCSFNGAGVFRPRKYRRRAPGTNIRSSPFNGAGVFRPRKLGYQAHNEWYRQPSMGPGSFDPGSGHKRTQSCTVRKPFNGAGVFRPRKSRRMSSLFRPLSTFNGAGVFRPRKSSVVRGAAAPRSAFNGAGSFDPGSSMADMRTAYNAHPSMGPGLFRPRKCAHGGHMPSCPLILQWGRGLSTPEVRCRG